MDVMHCVRNADAFGTVGRSHPDQEVPPVAQQLHRCDLDRLRPELGVQDRGCRGLIDLLVRCTQVVAGMRRPRGQQGSGTGCSCPGTIAESSVMMKSPGSRLIESWR